LKKLFLLIILSTIAAGCAKSTPAVTDNGNPGQIKISVFYDENGNNIQDAGEPVHQDRILVGQDVSCPPTDPAKFQFYQTDDNGQVVVKDLKPGKYCVAYAGEKTMSSKLTLDVYLSSDQQAQVSFGTLEK
jgi:uncharacterized protein (DUF2141 family)